MPDRLYSIVAEVPTAAKFNSDLDEMIARLRQLNFETDRLIPKLRQIGVGASTNLNATKTAVVQLTTAMQKVQTQTQTAAAALQAAGNQAAKAGTQMQGATNHGMGLVEIIAKIGTVSLVLGTLRKLTQELNKAFDDAREYAKKAAEEVSGFRDKIRELRATIGGDKTTTQVMAEVKDLMVAASMKEDEAKAFLVMWNSALPAAKKSGKWQLSDEETEKLKGEAAGWATAAGIDPETIGKLVPQIGTFMQVKTAADVMGQMGGIHRMGVESVAHFTEAMGAESKMIGSMVTPEGGNAFKSPAELMAGIAAITSGGIKAPRAFQAMNQIWRELTLAKTPKQKEMFTKMGLKPGEDTFEDVVVKIGGYLDDAKAKGIPVKQALFDAGIKATGSHAAIQTAVNVRKVLRENLAGVAAASDPESVRAETLEWQRQNPERGAEAAATAARWKRGEAEREFQTMRSLANTQLTNANLIDNRLGNFIEAVTDFPKKIPLLGFMAAGEEDARQKLQDARVSGEILKRVPNAAKRFPSLNATLSLSPTARPARGPDLSAIVTSLTPDERANVMRGLQEAAGAVVPARRAAPAPQRGLGVAALAGPGLPGLGGGGMAGGVIDPKLTDVNVNQLAVLLSIDSKLGPAPGAAAVGPMPTDGGPVGPQRK